MVQLLICPHEKKDVIRHLVQFYYYDLASNSDLVNIEFKNGWYEEMPYLDLYWQEEDRYPYLIKHNDLIVGFVLVHSTTFNKSLGWKLADFFVMRPFSGHRIGTRIFNELLSLHQGGWEVSVLRDNEQAVDFWRKVIGKKGSEAIHLQYEDYLYFELKSYDKPI